MKQPDWEFPLKHDWLVRQFIDIPSKAREVPRQQIANGPHPGHDSLLERA